MSAPSQNLRTDALPDGAPADGRGPCAPGQARRVRFPPSRRPHIPRKCANSGRDERTFPESEHGLRHWGRPGRLHGSRRAVSSTARLRTFATVPPAQVLRKCANSGRYERTFLESVHGRRAGAMSRPVPGPCPGPCRGHVQARAGAMSRPVPGPCPGPCRARSGPVPGAVRARAGGGPGPRGRPGTYRSRRAAIRSSSWAIVACALGGPPQRRRNSAWILPCGSPVR
jgi:hypothetical protein